MKEIEYCLPVMELLDLYKPADDNKNLVMDTCYSRFHLNDTLKERYTLYTLNTIPSNNIYFTCG